MCKYCGYEHGIIGDVVCPILKRFPLGYSSEKVFNDTWPSTLEVSWPVEEFEPIIPDVEKQEFKEFMSEFSKTAYQGNGKYFRPELLPDNKEKTDWYGPLKNTKETQ